MRMTFPRFLIITFGLILTACSGIELDSITATPQPPTSTPLQTPTIVWFPPTDTPTSQPVFTQPPTPDMLTGLGGLIASDDFSDPEEWDTAVSDQGSASVSRDRLTLAVQPGIYLVTLSQGEEHQVRKLVVL